MSFRSRREPEQVFGTRGLREPSRERITQYRLSCTRTLSATVDHDDTTETSSPRALDTIHQNAARGIEP
jgi:hypothetical protein